MRRERDATQTSLERAYQYFSAESAASGTSGGRAVPAKNRARRRVEVCAALRPGASRTSNADYGDAADRDSRAIGDVANNDAMDAIDGVGQGLMKELMTAPPSLGSSAGCRKRPREFSGARGRAAPAVGANHINSEFLASLVRPGAPAAYRERRCSVILAAGVGHADVHCAQTRQRRRNAPRRERLLHERK